MDMDMEKDTVVLLMFENGEHVIGKDTGLDGDMIILEDPVNLVPDPATSKLMFYPATQFVKGNILKYYLTSLRCPPVLPNDDILEGYNKQYGAGLVLPNSNIIQV